MLIEFRVENHRSLRDEQVLTMEAGRVGDAADSRPRRANGHSKSLLPVAVLYGANASGKSNVLAALEFMRDAVVMSHNAWEPDVGVARDPFAWGAKRSEPSLYEVMMLIDNVRYQYGFRTSDEAFLEEWLFAWPKEKKQIWFERDNSTFKYGDNLKGENKLIEEMTRANSLFVSAAAQNNHRMLAPIYSWFRTLRSIASPNARSDSRPAWPFFDQLLVGLLILKDRDQELHQAILSNNENSPKAEFDQFRDFLKNADTGIIDLRLFQAESGDSFRRSTSNRFELKHQSQSDDAWLPLNQESQGTQTLFRIALPILTAIRKGTVLLIDELEASLHPSVAQQVVRQFNDPATNPRNAQLICTTHDTNLMGTTLGEPALRRDQVWLTEKDTEGATVLYPLTDYKPRMAENIERGYLQGRYGAIPFLGDFSVAAPRSETT